MDYDQIVKQSDDHAENAFRAFRALTESDEKTISKNGVRRVFLRESALADFFQAIASPRIKIGDKK